MNTNEIKQLIASKIAGQGSAVDAGSALPQILNGITDKVGEILDGATYLYGADGAQFGTLKVNGEYTSSLPDAEEIGRKVFCLGMEAANGEPVALILCYTFFDNLTNKWKWNNLTLLYCYWDVETIEDNAEETDGYITPKGLVDYAAKASDFRVLRIKSNDIVDLEGNYTETEIEQLLGVSDISDVMRGDYNRIEVYTDTAQPEYVRTLVHHVTYDNGLGDLLCLFTIAESGYMAIIKHRDDSYTIGQI